MIHKTSSIHLQFQTCNAPSGFEITVLKEFLFLYLDQLHSALHVHNNALFIPYQEMKILTINLRSNKRSLKRVLIEFSESLISLNVTQQIKDYFEECKTFTS